MPLTNGSRSGFGSGSAIFVLDHQVANKKKVFLKSFSAYYFLKVNLHHFLKINSLKRSHKTVGMKVFLKLFLLADRRIRIRIHTVPLTNGSGSGSRPKNLRIRRISIRIRNTAVNRNIYIRDKLASDKINTKNLGRWLDLEIRYAATLDRKSFYIKRR
jgi:hypothetical protein